MEIGEKIKQLRLEKKISQKELAKRLGINQPNIVYFESRGNSLTIEQCINIATALEVSIKSLLFDDIDYTDVPNSKEVENLLITKDKEIAILKQGIEAYKNKTIALEDYVTVLKENLQLFRDKALQEKKMQEFQEAVLSIIPLEEMKEQFKDAFFDKTKIEQMVLAFQNSKNGIELEQNIQDIGKRTFEK